MTTINDPLVGTTYDRRYRIERRVGTGGMANVYLAEDETLGRRVAIKVLHQRYAEDSQFVERFLREASAAARLNHPNIVQVYDRGQSESTYYIAMEFVDGMTLKELVQRRGGLTAQEVLAYGRQALHALRFAHRNGIVHRDVKPHNMMVDTDGRLKIADFGIARAGADSGLTEAGSIVGTAQYLSPEQAQGHDVSATSDLYSLGVVMYEMATGRVPFDGESPVNVALKHVKDPVPRPSTLRSDISPQIESIILKAMEKDPARRYASADEMLADLDRAREGSTTAAMTQVMGGVAAGATTRVIPNAGATQVTPLEPITPVGGRRYERQLPPEPAWDEPGLDEDGDRGSKLRWIIPLLIVLLLAGGAAYLLLGNQGEPVPDVEGRTVAQATAELTDAGFEVGETRTENSESVDKNLVIGTDPGAGDKADEGSAIDLIVSAGPDTVEVPDVTGDSRTAALAELTAAGFRPTARVEPSEDVDEDLVTRTDPPSGSDLAPDSPITVFISSGPEEQGIPNVKDMTEAEARAALDQAGFTRISTNEEDSSEVAGTVIAQDPPPGDADPETTITLTIASGRNEVPAELGGQAADAAIALIEDAGFVVDRQDRPTDDPNEVGVVLDLEPSGGERHDVGTTIIVFVGAAAEQPEPEPTEPEIDPATGAPVPEEALRLLRSLRR